MTPTTTLATPLATSPIPSIATAPKVPGNIARAAALAATFAFTVVLLATLIGAFVRAVPSARPLPAPRPVAALTDFPDQARPGRACVAILTTSSAIDNPRSARATEMTGALLADACTL
jgi:hypothetical protein